MNRAAAKTPPGDYIRAGRIGLLRRKMLCGFDHLICNAPGLIDHVTGRAGRLNSPITCRISLMLRQGVFWTAAFRNARGRAVAAGPWPVAPEQGFRCPDPCPCQGSRCVSLDSRDRLEEAALRALAEELGIASRIVFLGWRDDMANLLSTADILVCSSRVEGLGNVIIEAWACHRPVIAARVVRYILIQDGETGLLADLEDAEGLAARLNAVIADKALAASLAAAGHFENETKFSEDTEVRQYLELLSSFRL